ncbi:MAG: alpha-galactosidase, partial [Proteiniphilum sp.]|nr:alpha-galactosidase [Proteiniphilum sp.]
MKNKNIFFCILCFLSFSLSAQQVTITVETQSSAVVLQTDNHKRLKIIYTGRTLKESSEYTETGKMFHLQSQGAASNNNAYAVAGIDNNFTEPAIAVVHVDGNNSLD